ncbi:hypothetical protein [Streptomyces lienomycini]|uniref:Uncharacterized protein n=1 Tax=Streptomyces lienomycini TaxID=284035 RepID=A0ABV9WX32_9ACTN|nr:hypothetical protein [Streptomyces lienomycini]
MQQPPLASLQAKAGNRAVTLAIQRAASTSAAAVDDMAITPVREPVPEQQTGGKAQGEDAKSPKELAVKAVADRKKEVADASLGRSRAADVVWQQSGKALEAREKAAGARAEQQKHTEDAEAAEQEQRTAEAYQQGHTETANKADRDRKQAEQAGRERREAVEAARGKAAEAQEREKEFTRQATAAEQEQKKAEADVVKYTQEAEEAEKRQKKAEADVVKYTQEAGKAEEEKKAAEAAEKQKAAAGETALQQAAKAEAEAEELAGAETEVAKWTRIATDALGKAEKADTVAREQKGAVGTAKESGTAAGLDAKKWEETKETAQQEARKARGEAERLLKDATAAAKGYAQAQADVANHGRAAEQARTAAREAGAEAEAHRTTATQARTAASEAGAEAEKQEGEATEAQQQAAIAARQQVEAGTTETAAKTAHTAAKTVQADAEKAEADAAKAKAEADAEAKMTPAAKAKRAAKAAKAEKAAKAKKTPESAEQTEEPGPSDAGKTSRTTMEQIKRPFSSTKIRKWLDPADTVVLRGTAPIGAPLQSHGAQTSDTGLVSATAKQAQVESGINVVNDALGAFNDGRDLWAGHKGSKETGPKSHQDRKKEKSKAVGLTTNGLMTLNDGPKIANTAIKNAGDLGGMAALGDVSGALVMTFSGIFVVRDTYVALTTHKKKNELKEHFKGVAAVRQADLRGVLNSLGEATGNLAQACSALSDSPAGPSEETLQSIKDERGRIEGHRQELLAHMASLRDYAVGKQTGKEIKRALNAGGNVARTAAGAVMVASAVGAVGGPIGVAVTGGATAGALGGIAAYKGGKKFAKRYESVRHPEKWARTTDAQEGTEPKTTEKTEPPKQSKDGKGGRKRDATKAGLNVLKPLEQGERQLNAQEIYALAAGPAVPAGKNVPDDVRQKMRDFLRTLNCGPEKHNPGKHDPEKHEQSAEEWEKSREEQWANSLNDPERQKEWEDEIAAQLSSA